MPPNSRCQARRKWWADEKPDRSATCSTDKLGSPRSASDAGFEVDYVTEATLTFPMRHAGGRTYSPAELRERTELVMEGRFASNCKVDQALDRAISAPVA